MFSNECTYTLIWYTAFSLSLSFTCSFGHSLSCTVILWGPCVTSQDCEMFCFRAQSGCTFCSGLWDDLHRHICHAWLVHRACQNTKQINKRIPKISRHSPRRTRCNSLKVCKFLHACICSYGLSLVINLLCSVQSPVNNCWEPVLFTSVLWVGASFPSKS